MRGNDFEDVGDFSRTRRVMLYDWYGKPQHGLQSDWSFFGAVIIDKPSQCL